MTNHPVAEALKHVLADSYALYLKTQNYHWNVEGLQFSVLHELFESQYTELATAIDEIAERIRMLGQKAPGTWKAYDALTSITPGDEEADATTMLKHLAGDQHTIIATLKKALATAQSADDEVSIGLIVDRMAAHEKAHWFLRSSL